MMRTLIAIPAFNEKRTLPGVLGRLDELLARSSPRPSVLVIDDGSDDGTSEIVLDDGYLLVSHDQNLGYGRALQTAIHYACGAGFDYLLTLDADGQHPPDLVLEFLNKAHGGRVVSGSRYRSDSPQLSKPPAPHINHLFTAIINDLCGYCLSDVGCGMKCFPVEPFRDCVFREPGYGFPLEFWMRCSDKRLEVIESPVPLLYLDKRRSLVAKFGRETDLIAYLVFVLLRDLADADCHFGSPLTWVLDGRKAKTERFTRGAQTIKQHLTNPALPPSAQLLALAEIGALMSELGI